MDEVHLYKQIAENVRQDILNGRLKPGDHLPSIRQMTIRWGCTIGTVQHAYQELIRQGLITSRVGQGTRVAAKPPELEDDTPLRRAALINRAEAFLLEVLTSGYSSKEIEAAVQLALDRWRVFEQAPSTPLIQTLRCSGSHDLALTWVASHFNEIAPGYTLQLSFSGSLGGLIAITEGKADLAGCHLWDEESNTYNVPFVRRLLPGKRVALLTLAYRRLGLILPAGNPKGIFCLEDLARPGVGFVNRQTGSGTRVWLDAAIRKAGIRPDQIQGYTIEKVTHSDVARAVAAGQADVGLGLEASARVFGLQFTPLLSERYDLVIPAEMFDTPPIQALVTWLSSTQAKKQIAEFGGYSTSETGKIEWLG
jgi:molybdate-binding protein/DNA-binding transcriptional regulator YhcF (GntR family)